MARTVGNTSRDRAAAGQDAQARDARSMLIARLKTAMDARAMRARLAEHWDYAGNHGLRVEDCELIRVMPRGAEEFVLEYAVRVAGTEGDSTIPLFGELVRGDVAQRYEEAVTSLRKARRGQLKDPSAIEGIAALPDAGLIVRLAGLDERIPALRFVQRPRQMRPLLEPFVAAPGTKLKHVWPELLGHRLGKRAAVRVAYEAKNKETKERIQGAVFVKMYKRRSGRGREFADALTALAARGFAADADVRVPALVAYLPEWEMLVMENVPGNSLADLEAADFAAGVRMAGRAIARLHACDLDPGRTHTAHDEIALLEGWVRLAGEVHDDLREPTASAMGAVGAALASLGDVPTALVHRDFYEKQVMIDEERTVLIDFDTMCRADPAIDLGNFVAHVRLARAKGLSVARGLEDDFLAAYSGVDDELARRVDVYTRATALRLVCLYSFWPRWKGVAQRMAQELS